MARALQDLNRNWFVPLALALILIVMVGARAIPVSEWRSLEAVLVLDVVVTLPALFWLCYRGRLPGKAMALRLVALMCLGLFVLTWIVPASEQRLLAALAPARAAGIAIVALAELTLLVGVLRIVVRSDATLDQLAAKGAPPWIARMMLLEARFWRWVFAKLKG